MRPPGREVKLVPVGGQKRHISVARKSIRLRTITDYLEGQKTPMLLSVLVLARQDHVYVYAFRSDAERPERHVRLSEKAKRPQHGRF